MKSFGECRNAPKKRQGWLMIDTKILVPPRGCCRLGVLHKEISAHVVIVHPSNCADGYFLTYLRVGPVLRIAAGTELPILENELAEMLGCLTDITGWEHAEWETQHFEAPTDRNVWLARGAQLLFERNEKGSLLDSLIFH
jgi:hypothetical protein